MSAQRHICVSARPSAHPVLRVDQRGPREARTRPTAHRDQRGRRFGAVGPYTLLGILRISVEAQRRILVPTRPGAHPVLRVDERGPWEGQTRPTESRDERGRRCGAVGPRIYLGIYVGYTTYMGTYIGYTQSEMRPLRGWSEFDKGGGLV